MKLITVGFGQCGGRIADEFARLNRRAHVQRGIDIITNSLAVNTDVADLSGLTGIRPDYQHRILIGGRKTGGHGVGKINELGAEIAKEDGDKIIETIRSSKRFVDADAFLLIAGAAGGTGSGALPVITQYIKERYVDKPVYNLVVLPFEHEESTEERTIYNAATCLKSAYLVADAVFLVDNQRYVMKDASIRSNLSKINALITEPFYNLLCAGEEKKNKYIGAKILDAGDIIQTLTGWTAIGYGRSEISLAKKILSRTRDFRHKATEAQKGTQAMDQAVSGLSLKVNPIDSKRALYLVSAPPKEMNVDLIKELGTYLKSLAPEAVIRSGDYPREKGMLDITVILSELSDVEKVRGYFTKTISLISALKKRQEGIEDKYRGIEVTLKDIPSLI
ncbi:MAG TPA: tubulin/FtsZ family protein [Dehalococcoidales bacterium]|nr:tubulin/FtsZ family protein [Dehalococcoidales bacterium]